MLLQQTEEIKIPTDPEAWRAYVATLDEAARLALFGVGAGATLFRCPTNGRRYVDESAQTIGDARWARWARCWWCDQHGRVRFRDADYDDRARQPHAYPIVEGATDDRS